ncbi:hypothetical protein BGW36DRAFT_352691 [Talaromyces proteolyticus]|uniref:Rhodopsin domain-containing protein n=1 Tax=Talaromyces proteolyticus TaxID=1131652 RepID=A0AAD4PRE0_9EURO|nr:uncharacterized protein BGW36DRAFT_352691 [Talaromyces proteolyticus]KAH8688696.1 hypothetical protein BGW36DRAFT_352691 [Talaromyces proteolyticus]
MASNTTGNGFIAWNPDLEDHSKGKPVMVMAILFTVLIIISTVSRLLMKLKKNGGLAIADYFIFIALVFNITANILEIQSVKLGFGRHLQFLERPQVLDLKRLSQYNILFANISLWAVKISICFFILLFIKNIHDRTRYIIYTLIGITTTASFLQGVLWGTQARPLQKLWNPDIPGDVSSVKTLVNSIIAFTAINSLTDLFYALWPVYLIGGLQLSLKKRLIVMALTGSGLIVFASSIVRAAFDNDFYNPDFTWALDKVYLCTIIERNLAEVIADLPASYAIIRGVSKKTKTLISRTTRRTGQDSKAYDAPRPHSSNIVKVSVPRNVYRKSSKDEYQYYDDEVPLQTYSPPINVITMRTSIDVAAHAAD